MKVLFFGSSDFSVPFINAINKSGHRTVLILTSADKVKGRGKIISPNPVKICAQKLNLTYIEDAGFSQKTIDKITNTLFDCLVVVSFGRIIPKGVLEFAGNRTINVHPSLLPKYRGPSPITTALLNGDCITGISLTNIKEKFDTGDIYSQIKFPISDNDNRDMLEEKIIELAAPMLISLLDNFKKAITETRPQPETGVSYTKIFKKKDFQIDWSRNTAEIFNKIRAFSSTPGSFTIWKDKNIKILKANIVQLPKITDDREKMPGCVISAGKAGLVVACKDTCISSSNHSIRALDIVVLKPQGKDSMSFNDFINGYRIKPGDSFGQ